MEVLSSEFEMQTSQWPKHYDQLIENLQLEHRAMLRGLNEEIERLQQQCSSMQRQMIYQGLIPSIQDTLRQRMEDLESKLASTTLECNTLRADLRRSEELAEQLRARVRQDEVRYNEDIGGRNLVLSLVRKELDEKKLEVATLTARLTARSDSVKEKPQNQGKTKGHETRSSIPAKTVPPSRRVDPEFYKKILEYQQHCESQSAAPSRTRSKAAEKTSERQSWALSTHCQNGNAPPRTLPKPKISKTASGPKTYSTSKRDDNAAHSSQALGKGVPGKP